jgi:nucleoid DNA-binding protein
MINISLIDSVAELLYKHNCVIIPDFGGFITNYKETGFEESRNLISPPCKKVAFNQILVENDGLLVNHWSQKKGISYTESFKNVSDFAVFLKETIVSNKSFDFKNIGTFYLNTENKIIFIPYLGHNFLESSFGLQPIKVKPLQLQPVISVISEKSLKEIAIPEISIVPETTLYQTEKVIKPNYFKNPLFLKAASIALIVAFIIFTINFLITNSRGLIAGYKQKNEQQASIIPIDTNSEKSVKVKTVTLSTLDYDAEHKKIDELKTQVTTLSEGNPSRQETYNVVVGYYETEVQAQKFLKKLSVDYSNAKLANKTTEGFGILVESFYKHTTADAFSVMLKQNGYKNIKIEKQIVIGE